uniref:Large ribosomal subunit protein uL24c n=1 Tax=Trichogloeopsis pedicellata TaxID=1495610 RepID=A0A1G4P0N3_9FLOR|nr:Ribosomal protein L24 [Trichogloeopsis pedicellata]SCW24457.1 Ribosomal protein L24 [Trichogloeopsis pedicellata]
MMGKKNKKNKLHITVGDTVKIITGDNKGQVGKVLKTFSSTMQVIVQDINMKTKHIRPQQEGETGQIIRKEAPIHSSNVMLYDVNTNLASRYRKKSKPAKI